MKPNGGALLGTAYRVSIPKRVSEALKLKQFEDLQSIANVSIPKRVSEALKLETDELPHPASRGFNP